MDRRGFFKTIMTTSLLAPLLLASKKADNELELYLIADNPQDYISILLRELGRHTIFSERTYTFLTSHPHSDELSKILAAAGWSYEGVSHKAHMAISFSTLHGNARPSFTLVKEGRVIDIRSNKLRALWKEMNQPRPFSTCLTTASIRHSRKPLQQGTHVVVYQDGAKATVLSLDKESLQTFRAREGLITVKIAGGKAWVEEASCRNKICVHSQPVSLSGERIICAPNHFMISVVGNSGAVDTMIG
jgi:hypothetical protein